MAKRPNVKFDGKNHWFSLPHAAKVAGVTKPDLRRRAIAGELRFQTDNEGWPFWFLATEIHSLQDAARAAKAAMPARAPRYPRARTAEQLEAKWETESAKREPRWRTGRSGNLGTLALPWGKFINPKQSVD